MIRKSNFYVKHNQPTTLHDVF